jgi:hypothetical protein
LAKNSLILCGLMFMMGSIGFAQEQLCIPMVRPHEGIFANTLTNCEKSEGMKPGSSMEEVRTGVDSRITKFRLFNSPNSQMNIQFDSKNLPMKVVIFDKYRNSKSPVYSITSLENGKFESEIACSIEKKCTAVNQKICHEILGRFKGNKKELSACFTSINEVEKLVSKQIQNSHADIKKEGPFQNIISQLGESFVANQNFKVDWVHPYDLVRIMDSCLQYQEMNFHWKTEPAKAKVQSEKSAFR